MGSVNLLKAEVSHSYFLTKEELLNSFFNKESFKSEYYSKAEKQRKDDFDRLNKQLSKETIKQDNYNSLEIEKYVREHNRLKVEAIRKVYDERLDIAIKELNNLIRENEKLTKAGRFSETEYLVDLRAKVNNLPFLKQNNATELNNKLAEKNIALQKKFNDDKVRFYVLLNVFYPENKWIRYEKDGKLHYDIITPDETDKYLKEYTEELCRLSGLSSKGILLNVESVLSQDRVKNIFFFKYPVYIATGKDLKNSEKKSLHELIEVSSQLASKDFRFELDGQDPDTDVAFAHRATVLGNYVYQLPALLLELTDKNLVGTENYKYLVTLTHLTDEEKQNIRLLLNSTSASSQSASFTNFNGTGLKDYAGMKLFLDRFLVSDLSKWKAQNNSANLKIITTSDKRLYKGKDARDLVLSEKAANNDFIVAMHFKEENGEIVVHWDTKLGDNFVFLANENLDSLWKEISVLSNNEVFQKYFEVGLDSIDYGFSQITTFIGTISKVIKDNRIPEDWYKWDNTVAFFAGMINGILDDISGTSDVVRMSISVVGEAHVIPYKLVLFTYKYAFNENTRSTVNQTLLLLYDNRENVYRAFNDLLGKLVDAGCSAAGKCWTGIKNYGSVLSQGDYKSFYQYGYLLEQVAALFIGVAEISAIIKGERFVAVLAKSADNLYNSFKGLIGAVGNLITKNVDAGARAIRVIITDLAEYGRLLADNFGSLLDDLYFASLNTYKSIFYKTPNDFNGLVLAYASGYSYRFMNQADQLPYSSFKDFIKKMDSFINKNLDQYGAKVDPSDFDNLDKVKTATAKALYEKNLDNIKRVGSKSQFEKLSSKVPDPEKLGQILDKLQGVPMDKITGIMNNVPANKVDDLITSGLLDQIKARSNLADDLAGSNDLAIKISKLIDDPKIINGWDILKNRPQMRKDWDIVASASNFHKINPDFMGKNGEQLAKIIENLGTAGARCKTCPNPGNNNGLKFINEILDDLSYSVSNFYTTDGFDKLLKEMAASSEKADGGAFLLQVIKSRGDDFAQQIEGFEKFYLSGARFEADIKLHSGKLIEFKSWSKETWYNLGKESSLEQLKAYFKSGNEFEYVGNLKKLENASIASPNKYVRERFQSVLKQNNYSIFEDIWTNKYFIKKLGLEDLSKADAREVFIEMVDSIDEVLYSFIKVE